MTTKRTKLVPPDGGWGWAIVFGVSLVNMCTRALEPSFGLLFGDTLRDLNIHTAGAAFVVSSADAVFNLSGLVVGALCKRISLRRLAVIGSALYSIGLILTTPAVTFEHMLVTYSLIGGVGIGLASSTTFVALNHYFEVRRGMAVGLSLAGAAAGMLLIPQAVRLFLEEYGFRGAVLIMGALSLHGVVGSLLLQPVEWHMKEVPVEEFVSPGIHIIEMETIKENEEDENPVDTEEPITFTPKSLTSTVSKKDSHTLISPRSNTSNRKKSTSSFFGHNLSVPNAENHPENESLIGQKPDVQTLLSPQRRLMPDKMSHPELVGLHHVSSMTSSFDGMSACTTGDGLISRRATVPRNLSAVSLGTGYLSQTSARKRKESVMSNISSMDFTGSSIQLHAAGVLISESEDDGGLHFRRNLSYTSADKVQIPSQLTIQATIKSSNVWKKIYEVLNLELLKDRSYVNLLIGLSLFYVAEQNFKLVTPFFFESLGYTKADTAFCLSITAIMDIAARIVLPPICDRLSPTIVRRRTIFMISCVFLGSCRSVLAEQTEWIPLMGWFIVSGFLRGAVLINFALTVSEWCPTLDKLPAAFGLHMVAKGLFVIVLGPFLGFVRDSTGSYPLCLHTQTALMFLCVFAWMIEYIYIFCIGSQKVQTIT